VVTIVNWTDVEHTLARVEDALGVDDANLLRAALALRGRGLTMAEYQQTSIALAEASDKRPATAALAAGLQEGVARLRHVVKGDRGVMLARNLGDVLWHVAMLAAACGLPLDDVARASVRRD